MKEHHCILSIFGATGDLTNRKLLPALYYLEQEGHLEGTFRIIAVARREKTTEEYREEALNSIRKFSKRKLQEDILKKLIFKIHYHRLEFQDLNGYLSLRKVIENISGEKGQSCKRIFYLAVPSNFFGVITDNLKKAGLAEKGHSDKIYNRVMYEKPFGQDLGSAQNLNDAITKVFDEKEVYRIDHFLAKELVQNLIVLRFANSIFEPLWNKEYIDHVQITVSESLGVENRGKYYDKAGAVRDVMQNHMMQLLTLFAMSAPKSLSADDLINEKVKVLKSISKFTKSDAKKIAVIGQYAQGEVKGRKVVPYIDEHEVSKDSKIETFVALKLYIENEMWKGVPFYLRTGKRLKEKSTEIVIVYKDPPSELFKGFHPQKNMLIIRVEPYEGITVHFNAKVPGNRVIIDTVNMDFCHECKFGLNSPEAYERLLYDVMIGDQTLFTSWLEVENAWKLFDILIGGFEGEQPYKYEAGSWGPSEADRLIEEDGRSWVVPTKPAYADLLDK